MSSSVVIVTYHTVPRLARRAENTVPTGDDAADLTKIFAALKKGAVDGRPT